MAASRRFKPRFWLFEDLKPLFLSENVFFSENPLEMRAGGSFF
jgi:hypothetical protein